MFPVTLPFIAICLRATNKSNQNQGAVMKFNILLPFPYKIINLSPSCTRDAEEITNLHKLCRLCLQTDDFVFDIFQRMDVSKAPLPERIFDLYQVKIEFSDDGLPKSICHRCLYFTESFTEFRDKVRKCEARLQNHVATIGILGSTQLSDDEDDQNQEVPYNGVEHHENGNRKSHVTVIDPDQDYNGSEDSFDISDDNEDDFDAAIAPKTELQNGSDEDMEDDHLMNHFNNEPVLNRMDECNDMVSDIMPYTGSEVLKNVFLCQYCDMAFISKIDCAEHEARHDAANPHSCNYCPYRCASRQVVIGHIRELHDSERPYVCVQCNKGFSRRSDLKKHSIVHTGIRPYSCPVCGKNFSRNTNLTKHLRIHTGMKPHVCQKCPRSFTTTGDLMRHERVHSNHKQFKCKKCPSEFTRKDKLLHHERNHTRKEQGQGYSTTNGSDGFYPESMVIALDPFSGLNQAGHNQDYQRTDQTKTNPASRMETSILAPLLQRSSEHPKDQQKQKENQEPPDRKLPQYHQPVQSSQPYQQQLPQQYQQPQSHQYPQQNYPQEPHQEQLKHALLQQNPSQENGPQSYQQPQPRPPVPRRTGDAAERLFACDLCPKKFFQESSLIVHRYKHNTERTHVCPICAKSFMRKRELERHSVIHSGAKPFSCTVCSKRFNRKDKLARHVKTHAEDKIEKYPCTKCKMIFMSKDRLEDHLKLHKESLKQANDSRSLNAKSQPNPPEVRPHQPFQVDSFDFKPKMNFYSEIKTEVDAE